MYRESKFREIAMAERVWETMHLKEGKHVMRAWNSERIDRKPVKQPEIVNYICPRCRRQSEDVYKDEEITPNCMRYKHPGQEDVVIHLSPMEAEIFATLLAHEGAVITNERLIYNIYHNGTALPYRKDVEPDYPLSSIRVTICKLRQKLNRYHLPIKFKTVIGRGMKLTAPKDKITLECI